MKTLKQILHLAGAITFIGSYLTADSESWRLIHVYLGYVFGIIFSLRAACVNQLQANPGLC